MARHERRTGSKHGGQSDHEKPDGQVYAGEDGGGALLQAGSQPPARAAAVAAPAIGLKQIGSHSPATLPPRLTAPVQSGCAVGKDFIQIESCTAEVGGGFRPPDGVVICHNHLASQVGCCGGAGMCVCVGGGGGPGQDLALLIDCGMGEKSLGTCPTSPRPVPAPAPHHHNRTRSATR